MQLGWKDRKTDCVVGKRNAQRVAIQRKGRKTEKEKDELEKLTKEHAKNSTVSAPTDV